MSEIISEELKFGTFYLERIDDGKVIEYGGLPWATPYEDLAWFVRYGLKHNQGMETIVREFAAPPPHPKDLVVVWQLDQRWKDSKLGYPDSAPGSTLGNWGCVVCSIAMMIQQIRGEFISPVDVNEDLVSAGAFGGATKNLVIWTKVPLAYPEVALDFWKTFPRDPAPVEEFGEFVESGGFLIPQVDIRPADAPVQGHYFLVTEISTDFQVGTGGDPWTGRMISVPPAYTNPAWAPQNFARAIFRAAGYRRA